MSNSVRYFEVMGKDGKALRAFYRDLFEWSIAEPDQDLGYDYGRIDAGEGGVPGAIGSVQEGDTGYATFYVEVDDPEATLARVEALGGKTVLPVTVVPSTGVKFAYFADPEGHTIGIGSGLQPVGGRD
ncbi:MAG TPA: VOC family protein [Candidatus Limnocylindrales bacterium]|nr:VOC family protein [Candidatus Limnocylindrales bacterium]